MSVRLTDCQKKLSSPKKVINHHDDMVAQRLNSDNLQEGEKKTVPDSPGKSMLMKFIDCSGRDITEKVKEVNEKELEARLKEDFRIPQEEEETDESTDVKEPVVDLQEEAEADLEVIEISHPKVQEVLIVLDEDEDKANFDCILEKVDSSPEKAEEPGKIAGENAETSSAVEMLPKIDPKEEKVCETRVATVSKTFEEEFSKFSSQQRKATPVESEVDSDTDKGKEPAEGNFSADDENDEESGSENVLVANSPAWSSLSLILETQV